jgi:Zn-dependent peptidase ImmA (M78 family)/DNA-binding XRE family transcriptional regulator
MTHEAPSPRVVGQRLAEARRLRGMTQEVAAEHLGVSRPTFIAIEKGDRAARPGEIVKLAALYGQPVHQLVRTGEPVVDFLPLFRSALEKVKPADAEELRTAIGEFKELVENYLDLERRMKAPMRRNEPQPVCLTSRVNVAEIAEDVASRERQRLGLGDQPVTEIRTLLESEAGVRIFFARLPRTVAGLYLYADGLGGCMLINGVHPPETQRASIAHGYGHMIVDRHAARIDSLATSGRKPAGERFAEAFAMGFLMPASSVRFRFNEVVGSTGNFQVADLVWLKHFYRVSMETMALRLEGLGLLKSGTWARLKGKKLPAREAEKRVTLTAEPQREPIYPERYKFLAVRAYERSELSEKELANYLRCDLWEARRVIRESMLTMELDAAGRLQPIQANFESSLLAEYS